MGVRDEMADYDALPAVLRRTLQTSIHNHPATPLRERLESQSAEELSARIRAFDSYIEESRGKAIRRSISR